MSLDAYALLHLSLIDGIGPVTVKAVIASGISTDELYAYGSRDFAERCGLSHAVAQKLALGLGSTQELDEECALIEQHGICWAPVGSANYSHLLAAIHAPPAVLYWKGAPVACEEKTIAFVGSRQAHRYAEQVIDFLVPDLVEQGWIIVSGGAIGADSMAHRATVRAGGKTVAVVGSGLLNPYPASNKRLFADIIAQGGAVVSCFPLRTEAMPGLFPARNRIIAGISRGCVVVQAASKSGALITAHCALEQGRDVFAVPGPLGDELSAGCNDLIQQGAKLVQSASDIMQEYEWFTPHKGVAVAGDEQQLEIQPARTSPLPAARRPVEKPAHQHIEPNGQAQDASPAGKVIAACVRPVSTDDIALILGQELDVVQALLFDLQLEGRVQQNFAGLWERCA